MRKILFKGITASDEKWVRGYFFIHNTIKKEMIMDIDSGEIRGVYPDTISQFTGLKDKKGNNIYENDILRGACFNTTYCDGVVEFHKGKFILTPLSGEKWSIDINEDHVEIVGNIKEN